MYSILIHVDKFNSLIIVFNVVRDEIFQFLGPNIIPAKK